jgi:NAD(P)-dependent dehydrogenase (short-subunit alcohol dehydrogenase family)
VNRLDGKVAIVTGASPNIGGAIARGFAAEGAKVVCTDIDAYSAKACAELIASAGGEAIPLAGDVTDPTHADAVVAAAVERWGTVNVLVNNAVKFDKKGLLSADVEAFRRQIDIILTGPLIFTRAVARHLIDTRSPGSVINVLSTAAWQGEPGNIGYSSAKGGLINFTRSAAMELAQYQIRVNGFTPTATLPPDPVVRQAMLNAKELDGPYRMDFVGQIPLGRLPEPQDYVPALVYLASDESAMMTGSNITIDGGALSKYWPWQP